MRYLGSLGTLAGLLVCGQAAAADLTVTSLVDVLANDGACGLREAIIAANTNLASGTEAGECPAGGLTDTIYLQDGAVYVLTLTSGASDAEYGDLDITAIGSGATLNAITLTVADDANGDGVRGATIDAGGAAGIRTRVLEIQAHTSVLLQHVTIQGGYLATDDAVTPKQAHGAGIAVTSYSLQYVGTGTRATATVELRDCVVRDNVIAYAGRSSGAGIASAWGGDVTLTRTRVTGNAVAAAGSPYQTLQGGGIVGGHYLVIQNSTVADNRIFGTTGSCLGAGIVGGSRTTITGSTISGNATGGTGTYSTCGSSSGAGFASNGASVLFNSTVANNLARGSDAGFARGGGVSVPTGTTIALSHVTIAGNAVQAGSAEGGGLYADGTAVVSMQSTIVGDNSAKGGPDCRVTGGNAELLSYGHNLFEQNDDCGSDDPTDVVGRDAMLGPLQDNGGTHATMALGDSSPAVDGGACTTFIDWDGTSALDLVIEDQRGAFRPRDGGACDVGAYELVEAEPDCEDGFDEDVDGLTDCDDVDDCAMHPTCIVVEVDCGDGADENGDGAVDCEDTDCVSASECVVPDPRCGDGARGEGEACDDGNASNEDACLNDCTEAACGDGFVRAGIEGCDDANDLDGDGCSALCAVEPPEADDAGSESTVSETTVSEESESDTAVSDTATAETAPDTEVPDTEAPDTEVPDTEVPDTEVPDTEVPDTEVPDTEVPDTEVPDTEVPDTEVPDTEVPDTEAPDSEAPDSEVPDTEAPDTEAPDTEAPDTEVPDTEAPDTELPDTEATDSDVPDTEVPDTEEPDTEVPDTEAPDTEAPDTEATTTDATTTDATTTDASDAAATSEAGSSDRAGTAGDAGCGCSAGGGETGGGNAPAWIWIGLAALWMRRLRRTPSRAT